MKRWLTLSRIGTGSSTTDAFRPDFAGVTGLKGSVVTAASATECLVMVTRDSLPLDNLTAKARAHHGDENATGERFTAAMRSALIAEAQRLGAGAGWQPDGFDVRAD